MITKFNFIVNKCKDKTVLDIGAVEYDFIDSGLENGTWLHHEIDQVAKTLTGLDIDKKYCTIARARGYEMYYGNAEHLDEVFAIKNKRYDVIVAGDLIEHLYNPGLFLDGVKKFCYADTEIIISTPNILAAYYWFSFLFTGWEKNANDHVLMHTKRTLTQLLIAKGFEIKETHWNHSQKINGIRPFFRVMSKRIFPNMSPKLIFVCSPK